MLKALKVSNFTVFGSDVEFMFSPGLNVIVGENGAGKTHVLKLGYLFSRAWPDLTAQRLAVNKERAQAYLAERLADLFQVSDLSALIRRNAKGGAVLQAQVAGHIPTVQVRMPDEPEFTSPGLPEAMPWKVQIQRKDQAGLLKATVLPDEVPDAAARNAFLPQQVLVPSKEMVSLFKGLIGLFDKYRDFPLDISYRDLAVAMSTLEPRDRPPLMSDVAQRMQSLLGGDLKLEKGELVFERADGSQMDISLMAEGYRKLAMLIYLLRYGVVERGSTLFWDEPEANLNPAALKLLAEALYALGSAGVQVVVATHSLFLLREFEILQMGSAQGHANQVPNKYFGLGRQKKDGPVSVTQSTDIADIEPLVLLDESLQQSDRYMEANP